MEINIKVVTSADSIEDLVTALLTRAQELFPDQGISVEIASLDATVVCRIHHPTLLKSGRPWLAIVELTAKWEDLSFGKRAMVVRERKDVVQHYEMIVAQSEVLLGIEIPGACLAK